MGRRSRGRGLAEGADAAGGTRDSGREPEGVERDRGGKIPALLFRSRRHDQGERQRLLPVYAGTTDALWLARVPEPDFRGGLGGHFLPPPLPRRGGAGGGYGRVAAQA